jgi:predicted house-cleaning noncanonical NTP pyrophosphatase (MazG superfamily)
MEYKHVETDLTIENEYPKLVRDNIPEIIEKDTGQKPETRTLEGEEFQKYLLKKMVEESTELRGAKDKEHLAEELADMFEIIDELLTVSDLKPEEIREIQKQKAEKRGGFRKRILMLGKV